MATAAQEMPSVGDPARPRAILRLNALASVVTGLVMLLIAGPFARLLDLGDRGLLAAAGLVLVVLGSDELFVSVHRGLRRAHLHLFAIVDLALLAGGVAFLAAGPTALTILERAIIAIAAIAVGLFAIENELEARRLS